MTNYPAPINSETRTASMLAHLSGPISAVVSVGWLAIVGPLIVWLIYRDRSEFVRARPPKPSTSSSPCGWRRSSAAC